MRRISFRSWVRVDLELAASWGEYWCNSVMEMIEVGLRGLAVRAMRESDCDE